MPALNAPLRRAVALAVLISALPLLLHLPAMVAWGTAAIALVAGWSALRKPLPASLRIVLVVVITGAIVLGFGFRVGRDFGSALMLAMLVLKLAELRDLGDARRVTAFALFAPFAAFLQDQGPVTLALGAAGIVGVLLAMARLAQAPKPPADWRVESMALGRALLLASPLALVGFWLFPRLPTPLWGLPENALAKSGISETMSPGDWIDLMADDRPAFRVRFDGPRPPNNTLYWRGPVLSRFDGRTWRLNSWLASYPAPQFPTGPAPLRYTLTLEPTERRYVFALESPSGWPSGVEPGFDATLRVREAQRALRQYQFEAVPSAPYQSELSEPLRRSHLALPEGFNPRTLERARQWRTSADTDEAYIQRVMAWINAEHAYSIDAPPLGRHTADEFLFDTQVGFCEHFSSAFVILMRGAGIPARVVTGYTGGVQNRVGNYFVVRQMDAHAWAEVWLAGQGWVRMDPTAAVAPERIFDTLENSADGGIGSTFRPVFDFGDSVREAWNNFVVAYDAVRQTQLLERAGWRGAGAAEVGQAFVFAAGLALGLTLLVLLWPPKGERDPLIRAWRRFLARWARSGIAKRSDETAEAFLHRLETAKGDTSEARALVKTFIALRYAAPDPESMAQREALTHALRRYRPPRD